MQSEPRPLATATLSRVENYRDECLSISAEVHIGRSHLQAEVCRWVEEMEGVFALENGGTALRITFDRGLTIEESATLLRQCIATLGFDLAVPLVQWATKKRSC